MRRPPAGRPAPLAGWSAAGSGRVHGAQRARAEAAARPRALHGVAARVTRRARRAQVVFIDGNTADANIFASMLQGPQAAVFFAPAAGFDAAYNMGVSVRAAPPGPRGARGVDACQAGPSAAVARRARPPLAGLTLREQ